VPDQGAEQALGAAERLREGHADQDPDAGNLPATGTTPGAALHTSGVLRCRALLLVLALTLPFAGSAQGAPTIKIEADPSKHGDRLPSSYLGISQEYDQIQNFTGVYAGGPNLANAALMRRLGSYGGGKPVLRVGGGSADGAWWNPDGQPRRPGLNLSITKKMIDGMVAFAQASDSLLMPNLNFAYPDHAILNEEAAAFAANVPREVLYAYEIGNEPDNYPKRELYANPDGTYTYSRPPGYDPRAYGEELAEAMPSLSAALGSLPMAGSSSAYVLRWVAAIPYFLRGPGKEFDIATLHAYALSGCPEAPTPTAEALLDPAKLRSILAVIVKGAESSAKLGRPLRITEGNSIYCGGYAGVSDSAAASLWMTDYLFGLWYVGVDGVNIHASSRVYRPFGFNSYADGSYHSVVGASYYGMLLFGEATANRARILPGPAFSRARGGKRVHAWGAVDSARRVVRVVVLNEERSGTASVLVRVPGARGSAKVKRLTSNGLGDTTEIKWGGQYFATPTEGEPVGTLTQETVRRRSKGRFRFKLERASAAMVTVKYRRARGHR
jgi:hypothetical protein